MKLSKQQLKKLQQIIQNAVPARLAVGKAWQNFYDSEMIGSLQGNQLIFDISDINKIKSFLEINGYPLTSQEKDFFSRTDAANSLPSEKMATKAVTDNRLLIKSINEPFQLDGVNFPPRHGIEFHVEQAIQIKASQIVLVENLELFLKAEDYQPFAKQLNPDALLVYRGGAGIFSTHASVNFLEKFSGERIGFFDFDPAGLCRLGHKHLDATILPDFECISLNKLKSWSREDVYYQQLSKYQSCLDKMSHSTSEVSEFATLMKQSQLAIMQEKLLAENIELVQIKNDN